MCMQICVFQRQESVFINLTANEDIHVGQLLQQLAISTKC